MAGYEFSPVYEITLLELFGAIQLAKVPALDRAFLSLEVTAWEDVPKKPLGVSDYTYQCAVSNKFITNGLIDRMTRAGGVPVDRSTDTRSGIMAFDGDHIIGGLVETGLAQPAKAGFFVRPDYRGQGVGKAIVRCGLREFTFPMTRVKRLNRNGPHLVPLIILNSQGAYTFLAGYTQYIADCVAEGKPVSQEVRDSISEDRAEVLAKIAKIETKPWPPST